MPSSFGVTDGKLSERRKTKNLGFKPSAQKRQFKLSVSKLKKNERKTKMMQKKITKIKLI